MKRVLILFAIICLSLIGYSQEIPFDYTLSNDTIKVAEILARSKTDTTIVKRLRSPYGAFVDIDYSSFGSTGDTIMVAQSSNGVQWQTVDNGLLTTSTSGTNYYKTVDGVTTQGKGQMYDLQNNTAIWLVIYYKNSTATDDTVIVRYNK